MGTDYNTIIQNYMNNPGGESNMSLYYLINIILFGSIIAFLVVFVVNFIKAYKGDETISLENSKKNKSSSAFHSMRNNMNGVNNSFRSMKNNVQQYIKICDICGEKNDEDSKFCKNCGNKLI